MKRHEALRLINSLLEPTTPMDEKQLAAARFVSCCLKIRRKKNDVNDISFIRNCHYRYRCDQNHQIFFLENGLEYYSRYPVFGHDNARLIIIP